MRLYVRSLRGALASTLALAGLALAGCGSGGGDGVFGGGGGGGGGEPSHDASLAALSVSAGSLTPAFDPDIDFYFVGPGYFASIATVTATPTDPGATMTVIGPGDLDDSEPLEPGVPSRLYGLASGGFAGLQVDVTAEDGTTVRSYLVAFNFDAPSTGTYVKASTIDPNDLFGTAVAVSGDTLVVGARREASGAVGVGGSEDDDSAPGSGAVYVFVRSGPTWVQQAFVKAPNTDSDDEFGGTVAIDGDTMVVGAQYEDSASVDPNDDSAPSAGAAYVYVRTAGVWSFQAYLKASNVQSGDLFGASVAILGDRIVVGAPDESSNAAGVNGDQLNDDAPSSGAAYVFVRAGSLWTQEAYLKASNAQTGDEFGVAVAIGSERIAVGAPGEDSAATGLNGNQVDDTAPDSGAVYLFLYEVGAWWPDGYLKPSNTGTGDAFGTSVAVNVVLPGSQELFPLDFRLETVVVGAPGESSDSTVIDGDGANDNAPLSGAAYVYRNVFPFLGDEWGETYFKAPNADAGDQFGTAVAFVYGRLVVGAPVESSVAGGINGDAEDDSELQAGAAYEFFDTGGAWLADAYIKATNTRAGDLFGTAVAIDNGWIAVGAIGQDGGVTGIDGNQAIFGVLESGAVYVYP